MKNLTSTVIHSKSFIFKSDPSFLYPVLKEIVSYVQENIPFIKFYGLVEGKCKLILTELLTNSLKHSQTSQTEFSITIGEDFLEISKKDNGKSFHLPAFRNREELEWPISESYLGHKIVIYEDDMCGLYGKIGEENTVIFSAVDHPISIPPRPRDMLEHFGLIILTKSSEEFEYKYEVTSQSNIFKTVIHF